MGIKNGARRRTPGGAFLQLLREAEEPDIDVEKVKKFFNDCHKREQRQMLKAKKKKKKKNFETEIEDFLKLKKEMASAKNENNDTEMAVDSVSKEEAMDNDGILDK